MRAQLKANSRQQSSMTYSSRRRNNSVSSIVNGIKTTKQRVYARKKKKHKTVIWIMSKNLFVRVKELHDATDTYHQAATKLINDYQLNVFQTAAVVAASKIDKDKVQYEKKKELLHKQVEKEKEMSRATIERVYKSAKESIETMINDKKREVQEAIEGMERQRKEEVERVEKETREITIKELRGTKRKYSIIRVSSEDHDLFEVNTTDEMFTCADCGRQSPNMLMCSGCLATVYCDENCQGRDWREHKELCTHPEQLD